MAHSLACRGVVVRNGVSKAAWEPDTSRELEPRKHNGDCAEARAVRRSGQRQLAAVAAVGGMIRLRITTRACSNEG
ncbi:hypothetical protein EGJ27_14035 [Pseudomonas sp. v388]|nr:hypothetical protein EGJ27_14035 [Pseudomonas sp. v388]